MKKFWHYLEHIVCICTFLNKNVAGCPKGGFIVKGEDVRGEMWIIFWMGGGEGTDVPTSLTSHT